MAVPPFSITPTQKIKLFKRAGPQKVDPTLWLRLDDPAIDRDAKNLEILLNSARRVIKIPALRHRSNILPSLYKRWRGPLFPLRDRAGRPFPKWRYLTPWMKTQMVGLVLRESPYLQMRIHMHDALRDKLRERGIDAKTYFRDRLMRSLRAQFDPVPYFYFVEEDRSKAGGKLRPHFHGAIQVGRATPKSFKNGMLPVHYRISLARDGLEAMEYLHGREVVREALALASGNRDGLGKSINGVAQSYNMWTGSAYKPLFNPDWISYAFKNAKRFSRTLPDNRLVIQRSLNQEAQRLWRLVSEGEAAISQWT